MSEDEISVYNPEDFNLIEKPQLLINNPVEIKIESILYEKNSMFEDIPRVSLDAIPPCRPITPKIKPMFSSDKDMKKSTKVKPVLTAMSKMIDSWIDKVETSLPNFFLNPSIKKPPQGEPGSEYYKYTKILWKEVLERAIFSSQHYNIRPPSAVNTIKDECWFCNSHAKSIPITWQEKSKGYSHSPLLYNLSYVLFHPHELDRVLGRQDPNNTQTRLVDDHVSHICGNGWCWNPWHLILEAGWYNEHRKYCRFGSIDNCPHLPKCLLGGMRNLAIPIDWTLYSEKSSEEHIFEIPPKTELMEFAAKEQLKRDNKKKGIKVKKKVDMTSEEIDAAKQAKNKKISESARTKRKQNDNTLNTKPSKKSKLDS